MTTDAAEQPVGPLDREPPDARFDVERRSTISKRDADDGASARVRGTVEGNAEAGRWVVRPQGRIGRIRTELRAERRGTTSRAIACLTSESSGRHASHVRVEAPRVVVGSSVGTRQRARFAIQGVARRLKGAVE
jgi:hypothetical protein